jgi:competence protein ComEC
LLRSPLRLSGVVLLALAAYVAARTPLPDVLVAADGASFAVRGRDGRLQILKGSDSFAAREWLAADGDARTVVDPGLARGFACDPDGCTASLTDGTLVAVARTAEAFVDDCARAALVVTARTAPPDCAVPVIDRNAVRRKGAMALYREGERWRIEPARPPGQDRPWAPAAQTSHQPDGTPSPARQAPRDATPRPNEVDADD